MSKPIKYGVVGLSSSGWAAISIVPSLSSPALIDKYTLAALSTTSATSATDTAAKYSTPSQTVKAYYGSTDSIASDPDLSLVIVAVKTPAHAAAALPIIQAGKDVFVEWPLGNGLQEAVQLADAARKARIRTMVGMQSWQSPLVNKVRQWIDSGKIGKVISSTWIGSKPAEVPYWVPNAGEKDAYSLDPKNGATYLDIGVGHNLTAIIRALGPLASLSATFAHFFPTAQLLDSTGKPTGKTAESAGPDQVSFSGFLKQSGAILTASWRSGFPSTGESNQARPTFVWIIDGEQGFIRVESSGPAASGIHIFPPQKVILNGQEMSIFEGEDKVGNVGRAFEEFAKGSAQGIYPTFDDAVVVHKHLEAIKASAASGERVGIEL